MIRGYLLQGIVGLHDLLDAELVVLLFIMILYRGSQGDEKYFRHAGNSLRIAF
jgi:hypothetical protein